jgi:hypothetical protein
MKRPHSSSSSHPLSKADEPVKKRPLLDEIVDNSSSSTVSIALYEPLASLISQPTATYSWRCSLRSPMASPSAETLSTNTTSINSIPDPKGVLLSKSSEALGVSCMLLRLKSIVLVDSMRLLFFQGNFRRMRLLTH